MGSPQVPVQTTAAGTALGQTASKLFQPLEIREKLFQNRIWVSPMCQYSCASRGPAMGHLTSHHYTHYTSMIARGPSLTIIEATAVVPEGRISPYDAGLWCDEQMEGIARIVAFAKERKQKVGIQLAHAGRKASTKPPWGLSRGMVSEIAETDGWPVLGPTAEPWDSRHAAPREMTTSDIRRVVVSFQDAAKRAIRAGVEVIEIHAAHGYLLSSFLSRLTNKRTDEYGDRSRFLLEVVRAVREVCSLPLLVRISASEWVANGWTDDETIDLAMKLEQEGVDLLTLSSGGNCSDQKVPRTLEYQTDIAKRVRPRLRAAHSKILIGAVGRISGAKQAEELANAAGDVVLVGRQFLKEPSWVLRVAQELGVRVMWPLQYQLGRYGLETKL